MEAIGRLAGGVAHDFNNLLAVIMTAGRFVLDSIPEGTAREDQEDVLRAARRGAELTSQLLAFSRNKSVSPRVLDLNSLVQETDRILRRLLGADIKLSVQGASELWNVRIDPGSFEQVLTNLAVNARDAMPDGGKLTIETSNVQLDASYGPNHSAEVSSGDYVLATVSDTGVGMDRETQRNIFEPFFTTKDPGRGTGLGLSTCYGIVKQAGGYLWCYSELGVGTTFKIYQPRVLDEVEGSEEQSDESLEVVGGSETILLVDDDDQIRRVVARLLQKLGYEVIAATNGADALRRVKNGDPVDLLLTDVVMPEMGGSVLAERVRQLRPDLRVLFMSGYTPASMSQREMLESGAHVVQKPFTPDVVGRAVRALLDE
jgi:CheY-like chemotaxis protein